MSAKRDLETAGSFRFRSADIVWQSFEDETIVIDLASGTYYSLNRPGAAIWSLVESEVTPADSVRQLLNGTETPEGRRGIFAFWDRLIEENLIEERRDEDGAARTSSHAHSVDSSAFDAMVTPSITVYRDMEDLFQLDPIHDVNEAGWPSYQAPREG